MISQKVVAGLLIAKRIMGWGLVIGVSLLVIAWAGWYLSGGKVMVMTTPSMSPKEPVGSLVVTRPISGPIKVGEIVSFVPPGGGPVFAHFIAKVMSNGEYRTKGLLNSSYDSWTLRRSDIQGMVVGIYPALGRVLQAIPIWLSVLIAYWLLVSVLAKIRFELSLAAIVAAVVIPVVIYKPFVSAQIITSGLAHGKLVVYIVSTGILNAWAHLYHSSLLLAGHTAVLHSGHMPSGEVHIPLSAAPLWWQWVIIVFVCCSPLLAAWLYVEKIDNVDSTSE